MFEIEYVNYFIIYFFIYKLHNYNFKDLEQCIKIQLN